MQEGGWKPRSLQCPSCTLHQQKRGETNNHGHPRVAWVDWVPYIKGKGGEIWRYGCIFDCFLLFFLGTPMLGSLEREDKAKDMLRLA